MKHSKSSKGWLKEHHDDGFVKQAREEGYRSRAVYKLKELDHKDGLLRKGMTVVDLGAAPGGWCQYALERVGAQGRVIALDILDMEPIAGVEFIHGDFREDAILENLLETLGGTSADLVLSDMAPNISGIRAVDQPRSMYLAELALDLSQQVLSQGGGFLAKVFQGEGFDPFLAACRERFQRVVTRKPQASRPRSREMYVVAGRFRRPR